MSFLPHGGAFYEILGDYFSVCVAYDEKNIKQGSLENYYLYPSFRGGPILAIKDDDFLTICYLDNRLHKLKGTKDIEIKQFMDLVWGLECAFYVLYQTLGRYYISRYDTQGLMKCCVELNGTVILVKSFLNTMVFLTDDYSVYSFISSKEKPVVKRIGMLDKEIKLDKVHDIFPSIKNNDSSAYFVHSSEGDCVKYIFLTMICRERRKNLHCFESNAFYRICVSPEDRCIALTSDFHIELVYFDENGSIETFSINIKEVTNMFCSEGDKERCDGHLESVVFLNEEVLLVKLKNGELFAFRRDQKDKFPVEIKYIKTMFEDYDHIRLYTKKGVYVINRYDGNVEEFSESLQKVINNSGTSEIDTEDVKKMISYVHAMYVTYDKQMFINIILDLLNKFRKPQGHELLKKYSKLIRNDILLRELHNNGLMIAHSDLNFFKAEYIANMLSELGMYNLAYKVLKFDKSQYLNRFMLKWLKQASSRCSNEEAFTRTLKKLCKYCGPDTSKYEKIFFMQLASKDPSNLKNYSISRKDGSLLWFTINKYSKDSIPVYNALNKPKDIFNYLEAAKENEPLPEGKFYELQETWNKNDFNFNKELGRIDKQGIEEMKTPVDIALYYYIHSEGKVGEENLERICKMFKIDKEALKERCNMEEKQ